MAWCVRRLGVLLLVAAAHVPALGAPAGAQGRAAAGAEARPVACVLRAELTGVVTQGMGRFLEASVAEAEERSCALLVVIDTPGGLLDATRRVVSAFLGARVPVITFVGGEGARAASAGALITMAGHVAAMSPSTHLGAAHPVSVTGESPEGAMNEKVVSDVAAFARAIAERRGRDPAVAERMVRESESLTAAEAEGARVIDRVEATEAELLAALDGRAITTVDGEVTLALRGAEVEDVAMSARERIVHRLGDPSLAYALVMLGALALIVELTTPGIGFAGGLGALALLLAFVGMSNLPIDAGGVALLVVGFGLLVAELFVVSYGLLGVAGVGCLLLGAVLLVDRDDPDFWVAPDFAVAWELLAPMAAGVAVAVALLVGRVRRVAGRPSTTGREGLVGQVGRTTRNVGPDGGEVGVLGERWTAFADEAIEAGAKVRVVEVEGLWLKVRPVEARGARTEGSA